MKSRMLAGLALIAAATPGAAARSDAEQALQHGRRAFHEARYDEAADRLARALNQDPAAPVEADARHLLGLARLESGDAGGAARVLEQALEARDDGEPSPLADHLRQALARARSRLGEHAEAARLFGRVTENPHAARPARAARRRARALERGDRHEAAREAYRSFLTTWPDALAQHRARVRLAELERTRGEREAAARLYRTVRREAPHTGSGARARRALRSLRAQRRAAGPTSPSRRLDGLAHLVGERRFEDALPGLRALRSRLAEDPGLDALERAGRRVRLLLARVRRELGDLEEAAQIYRKIPDGELDRDLARRIARMHAQRGHFERMRETLLEAHEGEKDRTYWRNRARLELGFGRYAQAEEAFRTAGSERSSRFLERRTVWTVLRQGDFEEALTGLERIGEDHPSLRRWARYWRTRALAGAGRTEEARSALRALVSDAPLSWYGLLAEARLERMSGRSSSDPERGHEAAAAAGYEVDPERIAERLAHGHHGAEALVSDPAPPANPDASSPLPGTWPLLEWSPSLTHSPWDRAPRPATRARRLRALRQLAERWGDVAPEAKRALVLERRGFTRQALDELRVVDTDARIVDWRGARALVGRARSDLLDLRRVKKARGGASIDHLGRRSLQEARDFAQAARKDAFLRDLRAAQTALGDPYALRKRVVETGGLGPAPTPATRRRWERAHPIAWPRAVGTFAKAHDVPPYLMYGLMLQESAFHPHAVSIAHAYGLLQVIPRTGRRVASELAYSGFTPELLLRPRVGIYLGSYYLGRLLRKFRGQMPLALAAYNAGPHRVASWLDAGPERPLDVFVEEIPYAQARKYVQLVTTHVARYRRVYHGPGSSSLDLSVDADYRPEPNY